MKKKSLLVVAAAVIGCSAFATNYTWTGGGNDGLWTTSANWGGSGYPSTSSDVAIFNGDATVSLNTGMATTLSYLKVTAGTVTIDGTEGSSLSCTKAAAGDASGLVVASGATLIVKVPMPLTTRFDKWGTGTLIVRDAAVSKSDGAAWYLAHGTNIFDGAASVLFPYATICFGNGTPYDYLPVFIRDSATWNVKGIDTAASTPSSPAAEIIQEGADTVVNVGESGMSLNSKRATEVQRYTLKRGTLAVTGPFTSRSTNDASVLQYVQEGGTSTFAKVSFGGSAALRGGVMNFTGSNEDFSMGSGATFEISGGTLGWPRTFNPSGWYQFRYSGRFGVTVSSGSSFDWDWSRANVAPGTVFVHDGAGTLKFTRGVSTEGVGLELGEDKTVVVDSWCTVSAPRHSVEPWKLTLNNGSVFQLYRVHSRLALPLDLTVNGSGCIQFNGFRGAAIAHKLTVNGVEKSKGIYTESQSFVSAEYSSYICVPYVWTGEGDGESWSDGRNWDAGVPPSGTTTGVDVSRATRPIMLDDDVTVGCLAAMPNGTERKVEITGSGSISISAAAYGCAIYIPEACELALSVDLKGAANNQMALLGGGKLTLKKSMPSTTTGANPLLLLDGTMVLEGVKTLNAYTGSAYNRFTHHTTFSDVSGEVVIADGTEFTCSHLLECNPGFISAIKVRQTGGDVTFNTFAVQNYYSGTSADDIGYILEGGSLMIPDVMKLGDNGAGSSSKRYPGGSFEMSGGTLTCNGITASKNQNYVRLYGGDVYLKGNSKGEIQSQSNIQTLNENAITFYLGGVKLHPVGDHRWITKGDICLTGNNGNCKFMLDGDYAMAIDEGMNISGPGGIELYGNYRSLTCKANCTFTGSVIVHNGTGAVVFDGKSTLNGPSEFIVEDPTSSISVGGTVTKSPERIVIAAESCIQGSSVLHVKHLVVAGVEKTPGTYCNGRVVVDVAPASWLDGTVGDLSYMAAGTTTTVADVTTLSSLTYYPGGINATNTLTGAALTFSDGANIHVAKGDTLVIGNNVVLGGKVTKTGEGEVVFNGGVTAAVAATDGYWLTVEEGGATFDGAVTGVRLITCGTGKAPVITLNEHCTVTDYALVLTAYTHDNSVANVLGETHQNGATVDYSAGVFETIRASTDGSKDIFPLTNPNGGLGRYVLNSGTFRTSSDWKLSFMQNGGELGTFDFVQNGGEFYAKHQITFARTISKQLRISYTLNDGYAEFTRKNNADYVAGTLNTMNFINFSGGTVVFSGVGNSNFAVRQYFTVSVGGDVTLSTANSVRFPNDWSGEGTVTFNGGNYFFSGGLNVAGLNIAAGTVTLGENTALAATGDTALSLAKTGVTLNLDYEGQMPFKTLKVGDRSRASGVYSAAQGPNAVKRVLGGDGELRILEGSDPGIVIKIR